MVVRGEPIAEELAQTRAVLAAERRRLARANKELETLCYSISHDLRAPLRAIDGFSQALSIDYGTSLDTGAQHYIERIRRASERMTAQIDALLELSRVHAAPLRPTRVDLTHLARKICTDLERQNPGRSVSIQIEPDLFAHADAHMASLLLSHLFANAWKFTRKQAHAEITFSKDRAPGAAAWCVRDNGAGFNMAYSNRLFAPFQRLHKESDFEGIGLGLAIAQRIASRHDGRIWALAEPDAGATFSFTLGAQP